jgi:voltage-gated potassium channel
MLLGALSIFISKATWWQYGGSILERNHDPRGMGRIGLGGRNKMNVKKPLLVEEHEVVQGIEKVHPIQRLFLLDVLFDKESRPAFLWAFALLVLGTFTYHWLEGWSYLDSLYFCVISLATVGYGDLTPTTPLAKIITIIYVINGIGILLALFDRIRIVRSRDRENG